MKNILFVSALVSLFAASGAVADTYTSGKVTGAFADGAVEIYGTVGDTGEVHSFGVDAQVYEQSFAQFDLVGRVGFETSVALPLTSVYGELEASRELAGVELYGIANVTHVGVDTNFNNGVVILQDTIGVRDDFTEKFSGYSEVSYLYTDNLEPIYGYAEVGLEYDVTDTFTLAPSVTKTFDGVDWTEVQLEAKYSF